MRMASSARRRLALLAGVVMGFGFGAWARAEDYFFSVWRLPDGDIVCREASLAAPKRWIYTEDYAEDVTATVYWCRVSYEQWTNGCENISTSEWESLFIDSEREEYARKAYNAPAGSELAMELEALKIAVSNILEHLEITAPLAWSTIGEWNFTTSAFTDAWQPGPTEPPYCSAYWGRYADSPTGWVIWASCNNGDTNSPQPYLVYNGPYSSGFYRLSWRMAKPTSQISYPANVHLVGASHPAYHEPGFHQATIPYNGQSIGWKRGAAYYTALVITSAKLEYATCDVEQFRTLTVNSNLVVSGLLRWGANEEQVSTNILLRGEWLLGMGNKAPFVFSPDATLAELDPTMDYHFAWAPWPFCCHTIRVAAASSSVAQRMRLDFHALGTSTNEPAFSSENGAVFLNSPSVTAGHNHVFWFDSPFGATNWYIWQER